MHSSSLTLIVLLLIAIIIDSTLSSSSPSSLSLKKDRLIKIKDAVWEMDDEEVQELIRQGIKFMDITFDGELTIQASPPPATLPLSFGELAANDVHNLIQDISVDRMRKHLTRFTKFRNRYYKSEFGKDASEWVYRMAKHLTKDSPLKVTVQRMIHKGWPQFSVRCRLESPGSNVYTKERVILSAHLDSIAMFAPMIMPAPGADDDGSGVITQLEALRLIASKPFQLKRPVEFLFFAAEEGGLLGSQGVVRHYQRESVSAAVLHIDMDGYAAEGTIPGIGLLVDNTSPKLTKLIAQIIRKYTKLPIKETKCGYACSDHFSWHIAGYPVAALFEGSFDEMSPYIHTPSDNVDTINFDHMKEFVKVALGFALHMTDNSVDYGS